MFNASNILYYLASFIAVMLVITFHEFAHAFAAVKSGDLTPKFMGRYSLNPVVHFDLLGILMFTLVGFGWAKPVPINPNNFKNYRKGLFWTASAGVITNFVMAFLTYPLYMLCLKYLNTPIPMLNSFIITLFKLIFTYNICFCVFNLLPFYPLDGFRIIDALDRRRGKVFTFLQCYGMYILYGLIAWGFVCDLLSNVIPFMAYLDILNWFMIFITDYVAWPIKALWGLIF